MHIMVAGVVAGEMLKGIPRECIPAMIVYCFERSACEKAEALTSRHSSDFECDRGPEDVEEETFERMVVKRTVGVGDVEAVVAGVKGCWTT